MPGAMPVQSIPVPLINLQNTTFASTFHPGTVAVGCLWLHGPFRLAAPLLSG